VRQIVKELYVPSVEEMDAVMNKFDKSKDGSISFDEFVDALTEIAAVPVEEKFTSRTTDAKGNELKQGLVQRATKVKLTETQTKALRTEFDSHDKNKSGSLQRTEARALARSHHAPSSELIDKVMAALDKNKDGNITLEEFLGAMATVSLSGLVGEEKRAGTKSLTDAQLAEFTAAFKALDTNKNNKLGLHELRLLVKSLYQPSSAELDAVMTKYDKNKDGNISFDEFVEVVTTVEAIPLDEKFTSRTTDSKGNELKQGLVQRATKIKLNDAQTKILRAEFNAMDTNKSGHLQRDEAKKLALEKHAPSSKLIESLLAVLDVNKDGQVSLEEFLDAMDKVQSVGGLVASATPAEEEKKEEKKA